VLHVFAQLAQAIPAPREDFRHKGLSCRFDDKPKSLSYFVRSAKQLFTFGQFKARYEDHKKILL
jgi:hypothetical protein